MAILQGKQTAESYVKTLNDCLLPSVAEKFENDFLFQHDGATIHTAYLTKHFLLLKNIRAISWPSHSPDLNTIENVWGLLTRKVYDGNRVFQTQAELQAAILQAWHELEINTVDILIDSMPNRCMSVILNKGRCIGYISLLILRLPLVILIAFRTQKTHKSHSRSKIIAEPNISSTATYAAIRYTSGPNFNFLGPKVTWKNEIIECF